MFPCSLGVPPSKMISLVPRLSSTKNLETLRWLSQTPIWHTLHLKWRRQLLSHTSSSSHCSKQIENENLFSLHSFTRGKTKAVCCDLGHCSLLFKSDPNAVYSPPNAVYWLQGSFQRSSLLPLLSFAASPPFKPEKNYTSFVF